VRILKTVHRLFAGFFLLGCLLGAAAPQDAPLEIRTTTLPKAYVHKQFETRLEAHGGTTPLKWELIDGSLPSGVNFSPDGVLSGSPGATGEFRFTVTVRDSGTPSYQVKQQLSLRVVAPLLAEWSRYPKVNGQRLEGSILVSNGTDDDFDLTVVMLAVNGIGRAIAIGYQHFPLKKDSTSVEIPFGDNLPDDSYQLNVDVVAEVAGKDSIYRTRLVPKENFVVKVNP
jgi:hypothetical protein